MIHKKTQNWQENHPSEKISEIRPNRYARDCKEFHVDAQRYEQSYKKNKSQAHLSICLCLMGGSEKFWFYWKIKKISSRGPGATQALMGSSHSFLHLFFFSSASISWALVVSLSWRNSMFQSLELLKKKKEEISRGVRGHAPSPRPG